MNTINKNINNKNFIIKHNKIEKYLNLYFFNYKKEYNVIIRFKFINSQRWYFYI